MTTGLSTLLAASRPMTLARVASGFAPLLAADLARARRGRLLWIASDDMAMQAVADAARWFAPMAWVFGALCYLSGSLRLIGARAAFRG